MYVCMYVCMYGYMYVCLYVCMCVCMHVGMMCVHVCMQPERVFIAGGWKRHHQPQGGGEGIHRGGRVARV